MCIHPDVRVPAVSHALHLDLPMQRATRRCDIDMLKRSSMAWNGEAAV